MQKIIRQFLKPQSAVTALLQGWRRHITLVARFSQHSGRPCTVANI